MDNSVDSVDRAVAGNVGFLCERLRTARGATGHLSFEISYSLASFVELDMATTFSLDEKFKISQLVSAHPS